MLLLVPHEGHGDPRWVDTALHWILEPMHAPAVALGVVLLVGLARFAARLERRGRQGRAR